MASTWSDDEEEVRELEQARLRHQQEEKERTESDSLATTAVESTSDSDSSEESEDEDSDADGEAFERSAEPSEGRTRLPAASDVLATEAQSTIFHSEYAREEAESIAVLERHVKLTEDRSAKQKHDRKATNICRAFKKGKCRRGDRCTLSHVLPAERLARLARLTPAQRQRQLAEEQKEKLALPASYESAPKDYNQWELEDAERRMGRKKKVQNMLVDKIFVTNDCAGGSHQLVGASQEGHVGLCQADSTRAAVDAARSEEMNTIDDSQIFLRHCQQIINDFLQHSSDNRPFARRKIDHASHGDVHERVRAARTSLAAAAAALYAERFAANERYVLDKLAYKLSAPYRAHRYFQAAMSARKLLCRLFNLPERTLDMRLSKLAESIECTTAGAVYCDDYRAFVLAMCQVVTECAQLAHAIQLCRLSCQQSCGQLAMSHHITPNLMLLSCLAVLHTACEQRLDTLAELFQLLRDTSRYIRRATDDCTTGSATDVAFNVVLDSAPASLANVDFMASVRASRAVRSRYLAVHGSAQRDASFAFVRDALKMEGIEFAVQVERQKIAASINKQITIANVENDEGVFVPRSQVSSSIVHFTTAAEAHSHSQDDHHDGIVAHIDALRRQLDGVTKLAALKPIYSQLKAELAVVDQDADKERRRPRGRIGDKEKAARSAHRRLHAVMRLLRTRWEPLRALHMQGNKQRLQNELLSLRHEALRALDSA